MRGKRWVVVAILAIASANTGCVTCCHKGYEKTLEHGPECELPGPCRNQVYVFLINGLTPPTHNGLNALRMKLSENGFAKVGIADLAGGLCVEHEIKKIRACEPDAKFVLVGYDVGASVAVCIARDLTSKDDREGYHNGAARRAHRGAGRGSLRTTGAPDDGRGDARSAPRGRGEQRLRNDRRAGVGDLRAANGPRERRMELPRRQRPDPLTCNDRRRPTDRSRSSGAVHIRRRGDDKALIRTARDPSPLLE
jgi:hypothetical protein